MRFFVPTVLMLVNLAQAQAPSFVPLGTVSQIMISLVYPTSNNIFYVSRGAPKDNQEWAALEASALTLAESGNLLMMGLRAKNQDGWIKDARLLVDVGAAAFRAARAKDADALLALSDQLFDACVTCHNNYRPGYRRRR